MCVYLQVAGRGSSEDLDVGGVGVGELQSISQPDNGNIIGMSLHLAADVHWISLPGIHSHCTMNLRSI